MFKPSALKAQYTQKLSSYEHIYWIYSGVICLQTLSAILFKPPIWTNKLRKAAISKRMKLQGPGWSRSLTNSKLFTKLP